MKKRNLEIVKRLHVGTAKDGNRSKYVFFVGDTDNKENLYVAFILVTQESECISLGYNVHMMERIKGDAAKEIVEICVKDFKGRLNISSDIEWGENGN